MDADIKKKLDERLVNGEITTEEYNKMLETMQSTESMVSDDKFDSKSDTSLNKEFSDAKSSDYGKRSFNESIMEKGFFKKLQDGDYGLAKTYWLYGIVVSIVGNVLQRTILAAMGKDGILLAFIIELIFVIYYVFFQLPGLWRSAKKYQGPKVWAVSAQIITVIGAISVPLTLLYWINILIKVGI